MYLESACTSQGANSGRVGVLVETFAVTKLEFISKFNQFHK